MQAKLDEIQNVDDIQLDIDIETDEQKDKELADKDAKIAELEKRCEELKKEAEKNPVCACIIL